MDAYWSAVEATRLSVVELLASLPEEAWEAPSLCRGWRVRDVAGHLATVPTVTTGQLLRAAPRVGFDVNRVNTLLARQSGSRPVDRILDDLRTHAGTRGTARALDERNALFDVVVHSQDIALPLGRRLPVDPELAKLGLQRVWEMGWPFRARRRLTGLTLRATDTEWAVGSGPEVTGPALSLLLLLTGRTAPAVESLSGRGVAALPG